MKEGRITNIKIIHNILVVLLSILLLTHTCAIADGLESKHQSTYIFPISLQEIEEGAFSDTAAENIVFPDGLVYIGEYAFSGAKKLTDVFIPETTKYIADSAFSTTSNLLIHGVKGSYAEDWAKEHKVPFIEENIWNLILDNCKIISNQDLATDFLYKTVNPERIIKMVPRSEDENKSKRPQDRPELNPIDYRFP